jgi:hypothetical protein
MFILALLAVPFASQLHGQVIQGVAAGSSALWVESGQGAFAALGCVWTDNSGSNTSVNDSRVGVNDNGKTWVIWNAAGGTCAAPGAASTVYAYINLDSGIGDRCLFARPACTLNTTLAAGDPGTPVATEPLGLTDTALPAGVLTAFNGATINVAATDITPLDALFATYQALAPCGPLSAGTQYRGYGRGGWPGPGTQFIDTYDNTKKFNVIGWQITGTDPISAAAAAGTYTIYEVGATPVVVFVNTANAAGFGAAAITNIDRATLGLVEGNVLVRTSDLVPQLYNPAGGAAITINHRESLSGTYNTFDRAMPNNKELFRPQEQQCPPVEPMSYTRTVGAFTGTNNRVIGTGEMTKFTYATQDSIGYAFWSAGNFKAATFGSGVAGTTKYLLVDGVDPLCSAYGCGGGPGQIPTATNGFLANVNLNNIANGSYPIWSELRFVVTNNANPGPGLYASNLSGWAQAFSTTPGGAQPDFITAPNLNVFHMHFALPAFGIVNDIGAATNGGRVCGPAVTTETGGDAGGMVTTLQAGSDYAVLAGNYNTAACVGPTNTASFGVHQ